MSTTPRRTVVSASIDPRDQAADMLQLRLQPVVSEPSLEERYAREREAKLQEAYRRSLLRMLQNDEAPRDIYVRTVH